MHCPLICCISVLPDLAARSHHLFISMYLLHGTSCPYSALRFSTTSEWTFDIQCLRCGARVESPQESILECRLVSFDPRTSSRWNPSQSDHRTHGCIVRPTRQPWDQPGSTQQVDSLASGSSDSHAAARHRRCALGPQCRCTTAYVHDTQAVAGGRYWQASPYAPERPASAARTAQASSMPCAGERNLRPPAPPG